MGDKKVDCCELHYLETLTGVKWTGMRFCARCCSMPQQSSTLCRAIARSFTSRFCLLTDSMDCPGALRSLGVQGNDKKMIAHIVHETGADPECIRSIIADSPRRKEVVRAVELGTMPDPEFCIGYVSPEAAMKLLRQWQIIHGSGLAANLSGFMAVCSAVVAAGENNTLVFSLGCPDSRKNGGIAPDRLVAVLPRAAVHILMERLPISVPKDTGEASVGSIVNDFSI